MSRPWRNRLRDHLTYNPFGTMAGLAAIILGGLGIVIGDGVSAGMTNSLHSAAPAVAHLWGVMFAAGGVMKLCGLYTGRSTVEIPGLWMLCGGYGFYALTVVTGLGAHGLAAGIISGALTVGCLLKVWIIMARAREVSGRGRG